MWQEIGRCGRDGRSGIAICYGYARSVSMICDKCRKERKYHCKCNDREYLRSAVTVEKEHCQRIHCLKHFSLEGNSRFAEFLPLIYPPELEVKETTDTASSASFLDLYLEFDDSGQLSTKIYDKRDDFNFKIINFPNMCSNIGVFADLISDVIFTNLHDNKQILGWQ